MLTHRTSNIVIKYCSITAVFVTLLVTLFALSSHSLADNQRPNIVMIVVDDAGLTDLAPYGGEARMPTIQALADRGVKFTRHHSSPLCAPSRAMLLTGIDNHRTGVATIAEIIPAEHRGKPGYSLSLEPGVLTLAERLKAVGYQTYISGKWHLGMPPALTTGSRNPIWAFITALPGLRTASLPVCLIIFIPQSLLSIE
jgi:hypothetical protein